jgi:superfamily I DNA/RNA helicase
MVEQRGLIPHLGYRSHLAWAGAHIVREKPGLAGLDERFQIVDERRPNSSARKPNAWLSFHDLDDYLSPDLDDSGAIKCAEQLPVLVHDLALAFIALQKPRARSKTRAANWTCTRTLALAEMGWWIYDKYQQSLRYRGAADFDDLIASPTKFSNPTRATLHACNTASYILEDEAQDPSEIQERILRLPDQPGAPAIKPGHLRDVHDCDPQLLGGFHRAKQITAEPPIVGVRSSTSLTLRII